MDIKLYWASLKNEIDAETWKAGKCYITEDHSEERAEAQVGNDTLDINYCYRKIEQGIMQLQDIAHKYFVTFSRYTRIANITDIVNGDTITLTKDDTDVTFVVNHKIGSAFYDEDGNGYYIDESAYTFKSGYHAVSDSEVNNKLKNSIVYWAIELKFGDRQNVNSSLLATELHKYIVLNVLQEWCKIAIPTLTKEYIDRQSAEEIRIKSIMYRKEEPNWDE